MVIVENYKLPKENKKIAFASSNLEPIAKILSSDYIVQKKKLEINYAFDLNLRLGCHLVSDRFWAFTTN